MNDKMKRFLTSIGIEDYDSFDMEFDLVAYDRFNSKQLNMVIVKASPWDYDKLLRFQEGLNTITYKYTLTFSYLDRPTGEDVIELFNKWYSSIYHGELEVALTLSENDDEIIITYTSDTQKEEFQNILADFKDFLDFINYEFIFDEIVEVDTSLEYSEEEKETIIEAAQIEASNVVSNDTEEEYSDKGEMLSSVEEEYKKRSFEVGERILEIMQQNKIEMERERERIRRNKKGNYQVIDLIDSIDANSGNVDFDGTIFSVESKEFSGKVTIYLGVHDKFGGAIRVKFKQNNAIDEETIKQLKVKTNVHIKGCAYLDEYNKNQLTILAHFVKLLPPDEIPVDTAEVKRVELHLHSNMSNQDGVTNMSDYINYAKALGHKAIAVTDHGVVQAFPDAQNAAKNDIKVLYGCEFYMVDDELKYIINPAKTVLNNAKFVVLDFETTGLSARYNKIIEFGAVTVCEGMIKSPIDIMVNPEMHIPDNITNITGIDDSMVKDALPIKEVLPKILEYIGDAILVTHNAPFDFAFLQQALIDNGFKPLTNPVIDTLDLSKYLYPANKLHRLGNICNNLDIKYDSEEAHRANYDAEVLAKVWLSMLEKITKNNLGMTHEDLSKLKTPEELLKHIQPYHCIALVKNLEGVKDLYELVSLTNTKYFAGLPKLPRRELIAKRKNLIIGSACFNGEVYQTAMHYNNDALKEVMKFYDYIEVQPPANYSYLVNIHEIEEDDVTKYISDIIKAADEINKPVCATGDVHYLTPKEKVFRDVYISSQAVGGAFHPLNLIRGKGKNSINKINPDQHYRTTDEMLEAFSFLDKDKAYEIVVKNTNMIADQIDSIRPAPNDHLYTPYIEGCDTELRKMCFDKAHSIYGDKLDPYIEERLNTELDKIIGNGYAVVYYLAYRLVKKANEDGHIVGSRGSVGSSFAATMAGITEVNPLPPHYICPKCHKLIWGKDIYPDIVSGYDLPDHACPDCGTNMKGEGQNIPFETFLGFDGDKVPDIDLNFPRDYQATAHKYTKVLVGEHNVYRAGTIETVADKTAFGYVKGYFERPYVEEYKAEGYDEKDAKLKASEYVEKHIPRAKIEYLASGCIDVRRTTGQHPGGIVVVPEGMSINQFTPIQYPADDLTNEWQTTHFDFEKIHDTLLKLDMLGHLDPMALKMVSELTGVKVNDIPFNDKKVLSLFSSSKELKMEHDYLGYKTGALALPEFGTDNARRTLDETLPKLFSDLVILSGLSHGEGVWQGNAEKLIQEKTATLSEVIGCRDDIMTYLMSKGLPPGLSFNIMEVVRKKGKTLSPEMIEAMKAHNVPQWYIDSCNLITYLFPKGHATAYVIMAVRLAYFKLYYPLEFYATWFSIRAKGFDIQTMIKGEKAIIEKLDELTLKGKKRTNKEEDVLGCLKVALEMVERGYKFANISMEKSDAINFVVDNENKCLIPPFITLDSLGENNAVTVISARKEKPFTSLEDISSRTQLTSTNIQTLKEMGVLKDYQETDQISLFDFDF